MLHVSNCERSSTTRESYGQMIAMGYKKSNCDHEPFDHCLIISIKDYSLELILIKDQDTECDVLYSKDFDALGRETFVDSLLHQACQKNRQ